MPDETVKAYPEAAAHVIVQIVPLRPCFQTYTQTQVLRPLEAEVQSVDPWGCALHSKSKTNKLSVPICTDRNLITCVGMDMMWGNGVRNTKLNQANFIDMGWPSRDSAFNYTHLRELDRDLTIWLLLVGLKHRSKGGPYSKQVRNAAGPTIV